MGKFFLIIIGIFVLVIFAGIALLGFFRRIIMSIIPTKQNKQKPDNSILYDDGKTTVLQSASHDRTKRRS
ncbi:MAG: hypothetical protein ACO323_06835 [Candidatus Kapaibacteriota bacterium]